MKSIYNVNQPLSIDEHGYLSIETVEDNRLYSTVMYFNVDIQNQLMRMYWVYLSKKRRRDERETAFRTELNKHI